MKFLKLFPSVLIIIFFSLRLQAQGNPLNSITVEPFFYYSDCNNNNFQFEFQFDNLPESLSEATSVTIDFYAYMTTDEDFTLWLDGDLVCFATIESLENNEYFIDGIAVPKFRITTIQGYDKSLFYYDKKSKKYNLKGQMKPGIIPVLGGKPVPPDNSGGIVNINKDYNTYTPTEPYSINVEVASVNIQYPKTGTPLFYSYIAGKADISCDTPGNRLTNHPTVSIFPNPTKDVVNIIVKNDLQEVTLSDISGRVIFSGYYNSGHHRFDINLLSRGTYLLTIRSDKKLTTEKLLKL